MMLLFMNLMLIWQVSIQDVVKEFHSISNREQEIAFINK